MQPCTPNPRISRLLRAFLDSMGSSSQARSLKDLSLISLKGGMSGAGIYQLKGLDQSYVLRLLSTHASAESRIHQISLAKTAGEIGIGPRIHLVDPDHEGVIMDFIPGRGVTPVDFQNSRNLKNFAKCIQSLHKASHSFPKAQSPFQRFHQSIIQGRAKNIHYPSRMDEVADLMSKIETDLQAHFVPMTPTHLDLNPQNILLNGEDFLLVDWVNGGMSDPYFDLAIFSVFVGLSNSQDLTFLTNYFNRTPTNQEWIRFNKMKPVRLFAIAAGFLSLPPNDFYPNFYDDQLKKSGVISFEQFIQGSPQYLIDKTHWEVGLIAFKAGLDLIDSR